MFYNFELSMENRYWGTGILKTNIKEEEVFLEGYINDDLVEGLYLNGLVLQVYIATLETGCSYKSEQTNYFSCHQQLELPCEEGIYLKSHNKELACLKVIKRTEEPVGFEKKMKKIREFHYSSAIQE